MRFRSLSDPDSFRAIAQHLREGIYIATRDGRLLDGNAAFFEVAGVASIEELDAYGAHNLFVDQDQRAEEVRLLERDGEVRDFEIAIRRPDGELRTVLDSCYLVHDPDTHEALIHGILIDVTERKALEASLREASRRDALTGALNRRHLDCIEENFDRDPALAYGCIFVDIDNFKAYNDHWGHHEGDDVLRSMARFLMRYVRAEEAVVRFGGDEFVVLIADADEAQTRHVAERLRGEALDRAPVPFSLGYAARRHGESVQRMLERADQALLAVRVLKRRNDSRRSRAG